MVKLGEQVGTILPNKLPEPSTIVRISMHSALDYLMDNFSYMLDDPDSITSIFNLLIQEAMGYGDDYGDIGDAVEYVLRNPRSQEKDAVYLICSNASELIYKQITTYLPEFGNKKYQGKYTYSLGAPGDVFIRISNAVSDR